MHRLSRLAGLCCATALLLLPAGCVQEVSSLRQVNEIQNQQMDMLRKKLDEKSQAYVLLATRMEKENNDLKRDLRRAQQDKERAAGDLAAREEELNGAVAKAQLDLQAASSESLRLQQLTQKLSADLDKSSKALSQRETELAALKLERDKLKTDTAAAQADAEKRAAEIKTLAEQIQKQKEEAEQARKLLDARSGELAAAQKSAEAATERLAKAEQGAGKTAATAGSDSELNDAFVLLKASLKPVTEQKYALVQSDARGVAVLLSVDYLFQPESLKLDTTVLPTLDQIADMAKRYPKKYIEVQGHTDSQAVVNLPFEDNWGLAAERAAKVVRYLVQKGGIPPARIKSVSCAEFRPPSDKAAPPALSRRIEIVFAANP